jgi:hypothetical protein
VTTPLVFKDAREWGELVARVFSGDAPAEIVPPGIILASDLPEWWVLRNQIPWSVGAGSGVPAGGAFAWIQITSGPPVETVAVIERLFVVCTTPFDLHLITPPLATTSSVRAISRDLRRQSLVTFAGFTVTGGAAGLATAPYPATPAQGEEIPIRPFMVGTAKGVATALLIAPNTAATAITAIAYGYQRRLRPEEITLD